jgi:hypothetical protein
MEFFKNLFGASEIRVSIISILLSITLVFALNQYSIHQDISGNLLTIILTLIGTLTGINLTSIITTKEGLK